MNKEYLFWGGGISLEDKLTFCEGLIKLIVSMYDVELMVVGVKVTLKA